MQHGVLVHVLPPEQIADEFRRRHGLYLASQLAERHAVDAGEEHPVAPLGFCFRREMYEAATQHRALSLQSGQGDLDVRARETDAGGEFARRYGTRRLHPPPDDGERRLSLRGRLAVIPLKGYFTRAQPDSRKRRAHVRHTLRRHPALSFDAIRLPCRFRQAVLGEQLIDPVGPLTGSLRRQHAQGKQRVVQLVRIARGRPSLFTHFIDDIRVEPGALGVIGQGAPQRHRARAALLQRGVVDEGVGVRAQYLVRHRRGRGRLHADGFNLPALDVGDERP